MLKNNGFEIKRFTLVLIGTLLYGIGVTFFVSPSHLLAGGINGFAMLLTQAFGKMNIHLNLGILVLIFNIPAIIVGIKGISRTFVYYSVFSILLQAVLFMLIKIDTPVLGDDLIANAAFGGILIGVGAGICLRSGASLGGMDMISQYIALKKQQSVGYINLFTNTILLMISMIFFPAQIALYTMVGFIASNLVVDKLHTGYKRVRLEIITSKGENVKKELLQNYVRGITVYEGVGAFSGQAKHTLVMVTQAHEVYDVRESVLRIDKDAFITMQPVRHLNGKFNQVIMK